MTLTIRKAGPQDAGTILRLVRDLAAFEELLDDVRATEQDFLATGFSDHPYFECLLAEWQEEAIGFALFFHNYSTFEGKPGIYLEDIFVKPEARGKGAGKALLARIAKLAIKRDCRRLDLSVLHWNPARAFYESLEMTHLDNWRSYRLTGDGLSALAAADNT